MNLIILSCVAIVAFIVLFMVKVDRKIDILAGLVVVMVTANYLNEMSNSFRSLGRFQEISHDESVHFSNNLYQTGGIKHVLLPEQSRIVELLTQRKVAGEYPLVHFNNLSFQRLRLILSEFQSNGKDILAAEIDTKTPGINVYDLKKHILAYPEQYHVLVVQNPNTFQQLSALRSLYLHTNVSIILKTLPPSSSYHSISDLIQQITLNQNYFYSVMVKTYPASLIDLCSRYTHIDYDFYLRSQTVPLIELCCLGLPHTIVTNCVRDLMKDENELVPQQRIQYCFDKGLGVNKEGLVFRNGMVKVGKQYFWAGKCNKDDFLVNPTTQL